MLSGIQQHVEADFYTALTRPPAVYRGNPFQIEVALAYGGKIPQEELVDLMRHLRNTEARRHVREEVPFFTGRRIDPSEVAEAFEVPLDFLMHPGNHEYHSREWKNIERKYIAMPYGDRYIWGVTAGILRNLYERIYAG